MWRGEAGPNTAVITAAARVPIGRKGGKFASFDGVQLGAHVIRNLIRQNDIDPSLVTDVIMGNTLSHYGNPSRVAALSAGMNSEIPAMTIDRQCGSGINSVTLAAALAKTNGGTYIAGGMESMTHEPYQMARCTRAYSAEPPRFLRRELSTPELGDPGMGITAENLAKKYEISREEQDEFAVASQEKYATALSMGKLDQFLYPVTLATGEVVTRDEHPRPETTGDKLARLPAVFQRNGTVTAGNSSGINDGAAAVFVMNNTDSEKLGMEPLARIGHSAVTGVDPNIMGIGPVTAIQSVLQQSKTSIDDYSFIEINEAFAVQVLACMKSLGLSGDQVNPLGGAIAHGHPIAATGTILIQKAITELQHRGGGRAIVSACIGGGQGIATEIIV